MKIQGTHTYGSRQILRWLWHTLRHHRTQVILNTILGCLIVLLDFTFIAATKWTIDIATHQAAGRLFTATGILIGILGSQLLINFLTRWVKALLGVRAQNDMQCSYFSRLLHSEWHLANQKHSGDIINRLERDVQDVVSTLTETTPAMMAVCFRLVGAFFFLYSMDALLACISVVIIPLFILLSKMYMHTMRLLTRDIRNTDSHIQSVLQESIQNRMIIQTLEQQEAIVQKLQHFQDTLHQQVKKRTYFSSVSGTFLSLGFMSCYLITFLWGANRLYEGTITYGMMIAFIQLVGQIQGPFRELTRFIPIFVNTFTAGERLMELEEIPTETYPETTHRMKTPGIRINDVSYAYTEKGRKVLQNLTFDFPPGSHTAIIGETGAGKTTIIRLILSLIRPQSGSILLYEGNHATDCNASTRHYFTYVPQGNTLFSGTVRDNLLLGNPNATDDMLKEALNKACADFVFDLPEGLDTICNEKGTGLSEGQSQRIAIARALLRPGGILLLDEATSSLDTATEQQIWKHLTEHCQDKTLIFVTHRLHTINEATRTLELQRR